MTEDFCGSDTTVAQPTRDSDNLSSNRTIGYWEGWNQDRPCDSKSFPLKALSWRERMTHWFLIAMEPEDVRDQNEDAISS